MNSEELVAIDWLRAKTISYESSSEELHYSLILYNVIMNLQKENQELKEIIDKTITTLVNIDGDLSYGKKSDKICNLIDILRLVK